MDARIRGTLPRAVPSFIFIDRDGNDVGLVMDHPGWQVGDVMQRETGHYRVVEIIEPSLPDIDGLVPIIVELLPEVTVAAA
jgi:hypothetical protein